MGQEVSVHVFSSDLSHAAQSVFHPAAVGGWRLLPAPAEAGGGKAVSGAVRGGRSGGPECSGGAQPAAGGPYCEERLMRKERNPARPAVTRLCGICYGIKQKERLSGEAADKPGLGIITGMWSSVGM